MRGASLSVLVLAAAAGVSGCNQKDPEKCSQAQDVVKKALAQQNFTAIEAWREYAYKQCEDRNALSALDQSIVRERGAAEAAKQAEQQRKTETRQLLKVFLQWVADNRAAADKASVSPSCDPATDAEKEKAKQRLCSATRVAGSASLFARYWEAEPAIARFNVKVPGLTSCEEIGATKVLKTWQVATTAGGNTSRSRCEFPAGALAGLQAVVSQAANADVYVFNPTYLEKEPALRVILAGP